MHDRLAGPNDRDERLRALVVGVELGGTKCICTLARGPDGIVAQKSVPTEDPASTLAAIEAVIDPWIVRYKVSAIGVASFGPVDLDPSSATYGHVTATTKPGWMGTEVGPRLARRYGLPLGFDTDVAGAALAEGRWGAAVGRATFAYVTVGTGIGAGIVAGGRSVRGRGHPEAGHMRVARASEDDWKGACPFHNDCVEGLASGYAIKARAGREAELLGAEDPTWNLVAHALTGLCHNLIMTVAPEIILIGGGVMTGQDHLFGRIRKGLVESLAGYGDTGGLEKDLPDFIRSPALGSNAGPLGAVAVAHAALSDAEPAMLSARARPY